MPVTKSAKKKMRQDKKRTVRNSRIKNLLKSFVKKAKKEKSQKAVAEAIKIADKAAKNHIIAKNKAARIKSSLSKLINKKTSKKESKTTKVAPKKKSATLFCL